MPDIYVKVGSTWEQIFKPQAKVLGSWEDVAEIHVKDAGVWRKVWPTALPPTPTNLRFQFRLWQNGRYEVQPLWDPVASSLADGYHIEVTRTTTNAADKVVVDQGRTNYYYDIYVGTTGGNVLTYRVRSYKGSTVGDWSAPITTTTPNDAGFAFTTYINTLNDYFGHIYFQVQHDGNPENVSYDVYRSQQGYYDWTYRFSGGLTGAATNINDDYPADHYRGGSAGTVNTQNAWSYDVSWLVHLKNSWGKPNNQVGNPYTPSWGVYAHSVSWKPPSTVDRMIRLNAQTQNVYRQQPLNSVGWVGGTVRCGGGGGDYLGVYFYNKGNLSELGFRNRVRAGALIHWGLGRRNDGGNLNCTFNYCGLDVNASYGGDPRGHYFSFGSRTWVRNQGEDFILDSNWSLAFCDPNQGHGALGVYSTNSNTTYAEFGNTAEIMGGWVNGQITVACPWG